MINGSAVTLKPTGLYELFGGTTISGALSNRGLTITTPPDSSGILFVPRCHVSSGALNMLLSTHRHLPTQRLTLLMTTLASMLASLADPRDLPVALVWWPLCHSVAVTACQVGTGG
jgi:hypothetical protein